MGYYGNQPATGENNTFRVLDDLTSHTLTFDGSSAGVVSTANSTITAHGHRFLTGQRVTYNDGGGTAIGGLSDGVYYAIKVDKDTFKLANTYAQSIAGTNITFSGLGVGTSHTLNVAFDGVNTRFSATYGSGRRTEITRAAQLTISINGVIQQPVTSKTPTTGFGIDSDGVIVFSTAPSSSDVFWGYASSNNFPTFDISDNDVDSFTANGTDTDFTLSKIPVNSENVLVTIDGVVQYPSDGTTTRAYSVVGNVISFTAIPSVASEIQVRHIGFAGAAGGGGGGVTGFYGRTGNVALQSTDSVDVGTVNATSISGTGLTFTTGTIEGNLTVGGVLTYDDVTSVDSLGIITARSTIDAQGNVTVGAGLSVVGVSSFSAVHVLAGGLEVSGVSTFGGGLSQLEVTGISTLSNTVVGGATTEVVIDGDLRVTGIITTGTGSITFDGPNNNIIVGSGVTIYGNTGIISATSGFKGKLLGVPEIGAIDSSISDTAVDIFVYDTRKDSDGGAWRKRTQHTSWYNETLNTATRGSRREFPAVAVLVATSTSLTIYDGDDPDMPMWLNYGSMNSSSESPKALYAKNGIIAWAGGFGLYYSNYIEDRCRQIITSLSRFRGATGIRIGDVINTSDTKRIVNDTCNDVAMTVLPNAPIDSATGLPIPTIAVATDGGTSIIKDDGSVVDMYTYNHGYVAFDDAHNLIVGRGDGPILYAGPIPSADITETTWRAQSDVTYFGPPTAANIDVYTATYDPGDVSALTKNAFGYDTTLGRMVKFDLNTTDANSTMVAYAATSYNTGWMHGDIKGAFLSDTDATNVTGSELVTNGTFDTNTDNWTANGSTLPTLSVDTNRLKLTHNGANGGAYQNITTVVGETYTVSAVLTNGNASYVRLRVYGDGSTGDGFQGTNYTGDSISSTSATTDEITFVAETTTTRIYIEIVGTSAEYAFADNVVARIADPDRSVNNNGLQVFGTVTKSAVATGAELVAYSGFSASNYLSQPYNSDLDFGTGDMFFNVWVKSDDGDNGWVFQLASSGDTTYMHFLPAYNGNQILWNINGQYTITTSYDSYIGGEGWACFSLVRENGTAYTYKNGRFQYSFASTSNLNFSGGSLTIGNRQALTATPWDGDIALFRVSASAPSAEQIKKIYEDEKFLFQENAACTLYGSSDAVTALAYDEVTEKLHVGTSSGRSEFQGLRRINNTTTAVTTAISAYDSFVVEQ